MVPGIVPSSLPFVVHVYIMSPLRPPSSHPCDFPDAPGCPLPHSRVYGDSAPGFSQTREILDYENGHGES